jgi:5-methylcytosine-specific restriction endonuclease McrA
MRPVHRGDHPKIEGKDELVVFTVYNHARPDLIKRLGDYCSFCELYLPNPDVEHIRHKNNNPSLERQWDNFLLSCTSCNSTKGIHIDTEADVERHLWPDRHSTFCAFLYGADGVVEVAGGADPKAEATALLVGLCKRPGHGLTADQILRGSDRRWEKRREAWQEAVEALKDLAKADSPAVRRLILQSARSRGFFSVWLTVFRNDRTMVADLCASFPGTAIDRLGPPSATTQATPAASTATPGPRTAPAHSSPGSTPG